MKEFVPERGRPRLAVKLHASLFGGTGDKSGRGYEASVAMPKVYLYPARPRHASIHGFETVYAA